MTLVYVLDADHGTKVGITNQRIELRVRDLERAAGFRPTVVAVWEIPGGARDIEKLAHWLLRDTRTMGEWFHCHPLEAVDAVRRAMRGGIFLDYLRDRDAEYERARA